eukprot:TRINITY_DN105192_c1_g1_i1.p1 TRINITY_DN105192_c1_g1~~TRINITY_DN105192_c1_g1_i1.p1  ORF type:complete len:750 (+),score=103.99 TRINITY_DN105192_c1_g1_i1:82-2331(+)
MDTLQYICLDCKKPLTEEMLVLHMSHTIKDMEELRKTALQNLRHNQDELDKAELQLELVGKNIDALKNSLGSKEKREKAVEKVSGMSQKLLKLKETMTKQESVNELKNFKIQNEEAIKKMLKDIRPFEELYEKFTAIQSDEKCKPMLLDLDIKDTKFIDNTPQELFPKVMQLLSLLEKVEGPSKLVQRKDVPEHPYFKWLKSFLVFLPKDERVKSLYLFKSLLSGVGISEEDSITFAIILFLAMNKTIFLPGFQITGDILSNLLKQEVEGLYLDNSNITPKMLQAFNEPKEEVPQIVILSLAYNPLEKASFAELIPNERLRLLNISGTKANSPEVMKTIGALIRRRLDVLMMDDNNLTLSNIRCLINYAKGTEHGGVRAISLNDNPLGDSSIIELLKQPWTGHLQGLSIANTGITSNTLKCFKEVMGGRELDALNLSRNKIDEEGAKALSNITSKSRLIILTECGIDDAGIKAYSEEAKEDFCPELMVFFNGNKFGDEGVKHLMSNLNKDMFHGLSLSRLPITNTGAKYIADYISESRGLQTLVLSDMQISGEVIIPILESIEKNSIINSVTFAGCNIAESELRTIGKKIGDAKLRTINLSHCGISDSGMKELGAGLSEEAALQKLALDENPFGTKGVLNFFAATKWLGKGKIMTINKKAEMINEMQIGYTSEGPGFMKSSKEFPYFIYSRDYLFDKKSEERPPVQHGPRDNLEMELLKLIEKGKELPFVQGGIRSKSYFTAIKKLTKE